MQRKVVEGLPVMEWGNGYIGFKNQETFSEEDAFQLPMTFRYCSKGKIRRKMSHFIESIPFGVWYLELWGH